jgi:polyhydroxyalkanoate synthesis regulator phasin
MCLMCIEIAKGKMTVKEARRALPELVNGQQSEEERMHYLELQKASDEEMLKKAQQYKPQSK